MPRKRIYPPIYKSKDFKSVTHVQLVGTRCIGKIVRRQKDDKKILLIISLCRHTFGYPPESLIPYKRGTEIYKGQFSLQNEHDARWLKEKLSLQNELGDKHDRHKDKI